ncbi:uncharacterized protein BXZ73DRAFT_43088, partial [Epithele typhae]|uniref:uncharacterized protein n=1 Tax=Epithele typhae TaxID=378194 RepID=UPI0020074EC9
RRVLAIPELLELVFVHLEDADNAMNALVCKAWSEVALDLLWREVDDLEQAFSLLAPIVSSPEEEDVSGRRFSRPLEPHDWARFVRYSSRVRTLEVASDVGEDRLRGAQVFDEIAQTRTSAHLFPKLSSLTWEAGRLRLSLMLMHENVKQFAVHLTPSPTYTFGVLFQDIALRMPKLTKLDLRFEFSVREIEDDLCRLYSALPKLKIVILPKFCITSRITETLSRSEHIEVIQFEFFEHQGSGSAADITEWDPRLAEGAFPSLDDLSVSVHFPALLRFLSAPFFPRHLRKLYVHSINPESPAAVHEVVAAVVSACPRLTEFALDYAGDPHPSPFRGGAAAPDEQLTLDTLRPLLAVPTLTTLTVNWDTPLALAPADLDALARAWPRLEHLELSVAPVRAAVDPSGPPPLTLAALVPFARHCPRLRELGLFLAARAADVRPPTADALLLSGAGVAGVRFSPALEWLHVGCSPIDDAEAVARFLSRVLPPGVRVSVDAGPGGRQWGRVAVEGEADARAHAARRAETEAGAARWTEVARLLPPLARVRAEERGRRAALEREVEDLRMRCGVLEERRAAGAAAAMVDEGCVLL